MTLRYAAAALLLAMPLGGCAVAAVGAAGAVGLAAAKDKSLGESVDDTTTSGEIKAKLLSESFNRFAEVDVEVNDGLVLLSGRVDAPTDRVEAEGIAWTAVGAHDVANEIKIEPAGGFIANVSDEIISGRVRARLIGSSTVKSLNYNIETYDRIREPAVATPAPTTQAAPSYNQAPDPTYGTETDAELLGVNY